MKKRQRGILIVSGVILSFCSMVSSLHALSVYDVSINTHLELIDGSNNFYVNDVETYPYIDAWGAGNHSEQAWADGGWADNIFYAECLANGKAEPWGESYAVCLVEHYATFRNASESEVARGQWEFVINWSVSLSVDQPVSESAWSAIGVFSGAPESPESPESLESLEGPKEDFWLFETNEYEPVVAEIGVESYQFGVMLEPGKTTDFTIAVYALANASATEIIPEPMTILGMFLGIGSLTSYVHRRRIV